MGIGLAVIKRPEKDFPVTRGGIFACGLLMFCLAILGSKNLYILLYWDSFSVEEGLSWTRMFADAGYASLGAFSFYLLGIFMFTKFRVILKVADYAIPFTVLAQFFTKIGCFFAGMFLYSILWFLNEALRVDSVSLNDKITLSQGAIP